MEGLGRFEGSEVISATSHAFSGLPARFVGGFNMPSQIFLAGVALGVEGSGKNGSASPCIEHED